MGYAVLVVRILLGLIFTFFGLNFYLHFMELPKPDGAAAAFMGAVGRCIATYFEVWRDDSPEEDSGAVRFLAALAARVRDRVVVGPRLRRSAGGAARHPAARRGRAGSWCAPLFDGRGGARIARAA